MLIGVDLNALPGVPECHPPVGNPENRQRGSAPDSSTQTTAYSYRTRHCVLMADTYGTHKAGLELPPQSSHKQLKLDTLTRIPVVS